MSDDYSLIEESKCKQYRYYSNTAPSTTSISTL
jgi:hypothetical protein